MKTRLFLPLISGAVLLSTAALASQPEGNLCELYTRDLKESMMLVSPMSPGYDKAEWALIDSRTECLQDDQSQGVATLKAGIIALGLPVRSYN